MTLFASGVAAAGEDLGGSLWPRRAGLSGLISCQRSLGLPYRTRRGGREPEAGPMQVSRGAGAQGAREAQKMCPRWGHRAQQKGRGRRFGEITRFYMYVTVRN